MFSGYKLAVTVATLVLGVSGVAVAATGHLPSAVSSGVAALTGSSQGSAGGRTGTGAARDQYAPGKSISGEMGNHGAATDQYGNPVSMTARDKNAMGTKTLPNGGTVENHGMAVSGAAHQQNGGGDPVPPVTVPGPQTQPPAMGGGQSGAAGAGDAGMGRASGSSGASMGGHR
ncbi:MAG: hypothetical protein M1309_07120 [Actinobacteria bacterium]|nr:hypothetical protein [Actinomycetota bacterium]